VLLRVKYCSSWKSGRKLQLLPWVNGIDYSRKYPFNEFNIICSVHCVYMHPYTPKLLKNYIKWYILHISSPACFGDKLPPQADIIQRNIKPTHPIYSTFCNVIEQSIQPNQTPKIDNKYLASAIYSLNCQTRNKLYTPNIEIAK
jgi:hypothetical protein